MVKLAVPWYLKEAIIAKCLINRLRLCAHAKVEDLVNK